MKGQVEILVFAIIIGVFFLGLFIGSQFLRMCPETSFCPDCICRCYPELTTPNVKISYTSGMIRMYDPYTAALTSVWEERMSESEMIHFRLDVRTSGTENICVERHGGVDLDLRTLDGEGIMRIPTEGAYTKCWIIEKDEYNEWRGYLVVDMYRPEDNSTVRIDAVNTTWFEE